MGADAAILLASRHGTKLAAVGVFSGKYEAVLEELEEEALAFRLVPKGRPGSNNTSTICVRFGRYIFANTL